MSDASVAAMSVPGLYRTTAWQDHVTEHPHRRKLVPVSDGVYDLEKDQGEILRQGTPQSATNFNHMEHGILDAHIATALYVAHLRQQGWKVDQLAEVVSTLAASGIGTERYKVTIPIVGWEEDGSGLYPFHLDTPNDDISVNHTPDIAIEPDSMMTAIMCGLCPTARTLNGKLRLFAQSVPDRPMSSVLTLIGTAPDISPVSGETGASGGVTVSTPAKTTASDSDVEEMLKDIFG